MYTIYKRILPIFLLATFLIHRGYSQQYLGIVDTSIAHTIKSNNLLIIEQIQGHAVAILTDEVIALLENSTYPSTVIDTNPFEKSYYLVYPSSDIKNELSAVSRILYEFDGCYLVQVENENKMLFFDIKAEFYHTTFDPVQVSSDLPSWVKDTAAVLPFDPKLKKMLEKVDQDSIVNTILWLQNAGTRHVNYKDNPQKVIPWVVAKLKAYGCDSVYTVKVSGYNAPNVVGVKLGAKYPSYKNYAILGAHVDAMPRSSVNKGADDNASGTACVLEAARVFKQYRFEHTIKFIGFNCEEVGLVGSEVLAKNAAANRDTIISFINVEMCGHVPDGETGYIAVTPKKSVPGTTELARLFIKMATAYTTQNCYFDPSEASNSDHAPYWKRGFCAIKLREKIKGSAYHTKYDTLGNPNGLNSPQQVTQTLKASMATLYQLVKPYEPTSITANSASVLSSQAISVKMFEKKMIIPIHLHENELFFIHVYNMFGQKIATAGPYSFTQGTPLIDCSSFAGSKKVPSNGVYIIAVQSEKINVKKILFTVQ